MATWTADNAGGVIEATFLVRFRGDWTTADITTGMEAAGDMAPAFTLDMSQATLDSFRRHSCALFRLWRRKFRANVLTSAEQRARERKFLTMIGERCVLNENKSSKSQGKGSGKGPRDGKGKNA